MRMGEQTATTALRAFMAERQWGQFHSTENLIKSISIESGELLECVQWQEQAGEDDIRSELADVLTYCYLLGAKPDELILDKLETTAVKYPVAKAKGRSTKYDQL